MTKLSSIFAISVIPYISTCTLLKSRYITAFITNILFIASLVNLSRRSSVFPYTFNWINIFMIKKSLSVHCRIFHLSLIVASIWKYNKCRVVLSLSIPKISLIVCAILKNSDSKSFRKFILIKIALIKCFFRWYIEKWFIM